MTSVKPENPVDWWDQHGGQVQGRRAHVEQKLGQLASAVSALRRLRSELGRFRTWLEGLRLGPDGGLRDSRVLLDPTFFVRLASVGLTLRHELANVNLVAGSGAAAAGPASSAGEGSGDPAATQAAEREAFTGQVAQILDAGSVWGGQGTADVIDRFGVTEGAKKGFASFMAGELWDGLTSPFETYQEHKFTHLAFDALDEFRESHGGDLAEMSSAYNDATNALGRLESLLDGARLDDAGSTLGGHAASELRDAVRSYEQIQTTAGAAGAQTSGPTWEEMLAHSADAYPQDSALTSDEDYEITEAPPISEEEYQRYVREQLGDGAPPAPGSGPDAEPPAGP